MEYIEAGYDADAMVAIFSRAMCILSGWHVYNDRTQEYTYIRRDWHCREQLRYPLHPVIKKAMRMSRPDDWQLLLLQWPHISTTDTTRLAYTRDEKSGEADRQVVTTIGKYLRQHFTRLPDHAIRDLVATQTTAEFKFIHDNDEMIEYLHKGPKSCMVWGGDQNNHPYQVYDPALGWHMAVRIQGGNVVGRALCNKDSDGQLYFVRTYKKDLDNPEGYSHADEQLVAWLKAGGYMHYDGYPEGTKMKFIRTSMYNDRAFLAPYIDGCNQHVDIKYVDGVPKYIVIDCDGAFECDQTDGSTSGGGETCSCCGERFSEGDGYWVGPYEDEIICEGCQEYSYRYVRGRNGREYLLHEDEAVYCEYNDTHYDTDYLGDNDLVCLADGDLCPDDRAIFIEDDSKYYHEDDDDIVRCVNDEEFHLTKNCTCCGHSGDWYYNADDEFVETTCGKTVHKDYADEYEIEGEEKTTATGE